MGQVTFMNAWGSLGTGSRQFIGPQGVAVGPDGKVYVADAGNNRIEIFDAAGNYIRTIGGGAAGTGSNQLNQPFGVAIGLNSTVYVADTGNNRVEIFNSNGGYQTTLGGGSAGAGANQFEPPYRRRGQLDRLGLHR